MEPTAIISILQLLKSAYDLVRGDKNRELTDAVKELIEELRAGRGKEEPKAYVTRRIEEKLGAAQAKKVELDIEVIEALSSPPALQDFDYWSKLKGLVGALQAFASRAEIFSLRGINGSNGRLLPLHSSAGAFLPADLIPSVYRVRYGRWYKAELKSAMAFLAQREEGFPISIYLSGNLLESRGGYGGTSYEVCGGWLRIDCGQDPHWLTFSPVESGPCVDGTSRMLRAKDLNDIVKALQDDIVHWAKEIQQDQSAVRNRIAPAIEDLVGKLAKGV